MLIQFLIILYGLIDRKEKGMSESLRLFLWLLSGGILCACAAMLFVKSMERHFREYGESERERMGYYKAFPEKKLQKGKHYDIS